MATFLPEQDAPLDVSAVENAVEEAGFELLWLDLEVVGTLSRVAVGGQGTVALTVVGTGQRFLLYPGNSEEERQGHARLSEWLNRSGSRVVVRGRAHSHGEDSPALTIREFRLDD